MIFQTFIHPFILLHQSQPKKKSVKFYFSLLEEQFSIILIKRNKKIYIKKFDGPEWAIDKFIALLAVDGLSSNTNISDLKTPLAEKLKRCFDLHKKNPTGFYEDYDKTIEENV